MEAVTTQTASAFAGPSSEVSTPAYEEDARHFAISASQVPKPTTSMPPPIPLPGSLPDTGAVKDVKSVGTRFHEDCHETDSPSPRLRSSRIWKGKGKEMLSVDREVKKPMGLLDLPVDILKDIVKEVTHTNDLTSLALCHSALHRLTIPHIYSRFDIVWPDSSTHAEPRSGVDALTYGLATLVMAEEVFGESPAQRKEQSNRFAPGGQGKATEIAIRRRRGNHYAQFTKKFSLGNGPADWVSEYLITKEGGKMLGTLVALAVARMRSLETFVWDMPTGILRDVWLALSSLGERADGQACRLEKVWVRWHDNNSIDSPHAIPSPPPYVAAPPLSHPSHDHYSSLHMPLQIRPSDLDRVEHPSFSVLPAMRSLSVLDIDELAYLDEMAVLIGRSLDKLRELRVGIARHALTRDWVTVWEGDNLQQVDSENPTAGFLTIGEKRLGGVLGTLMGFVHDMRPRILLPDRTRARAAQRPELRVESPSRSQRPNSSDSATSAQSDAPRDTTSPIASLSPGLSPPRAESAYESDPLVVSSRCASPQPFAPNSTSPEPEMPLDASVMPAEAQSLPEVPPREHLQHCLELDNLELERVPLAIPVLQRAIDWSRLTSLTILHCQNHEALWKTLRRNFCPTPRSPTYPSPRRTPNSTPRKKSSVAADNEMDYHLSLKRIHTNTVSPALVSFIKETLAPNSLEVLFLQEGRSYSSAVTIDAIYRGPMRRHRQSLKKLLIDSSEKGADGLPTSSSRWRRWMLTRDILAFVCSGKMPKLRELGMAVDYHDWVSYIIFSARLGR